MPRSINLNSFGGYHTLTVTGAILMLISLFLPFTSVSLSSEMAAASGGVDGSVSNGWRGLGIVIGLLSIGLIAQEGRRLIHGGESKTRRPELVVTVFAGLAAILGVIKFVQAVAGIRDMFGVRITPSVGAFFILFASVVLGVAAALAWKARGSEAQRRRFDNQGLSALETSTAPNEVSNSKGQPDLDSKTKESGFGDRMHRRERNEPDGSDRPAKD